MSLAKVEVSRRFDAAPEDVFRIYTDHAGWKDWSGVPGSHLEREGTPERNGTGAVRVLGPGFMAAREEILEFEAPRRMTYRLVVGGFPMKDHLGEVTFAPDGEGAGAGTRIVWRCEFGSRVPGTAGLMQRFVTRFFHSALEGLAREHFPDRG